MSRTDARTLDLKPREVLLVTSSAMRKPSDLTTVRSAARAPARADKLDPVAGELVMSGEPLSQDG